MKSGAGDYVSDAQPTPVGTPDEAPMQSPAIPDAEETPEPDSEPVENPIPITEEQPDIPVNPPIVEEIPQNNETDPVPVNMNDWRHFECVPDYCRRLRNGSRRYILP